MKDKVAQLKRPETVVKLENQPKAVDEELLTFRYERRPMANVARTETQGTPFLLHFAKTFGTCPARASAYKFRDPEYRKAFPDDHADERMIALMIDGRALIPALLMAMTNGDLPAPGESLAIAASKWTSLEETVSPIARIPPM